MSFYRSILMLLFLLLVVNGVFAYNFGYIKINYKESNKTYNFHIEKIENYTYNLTFEHYGNIDEDMKVNIYLNDKLIYTIEGEGRGYTWGKKKTKIDITEYLNNGGNTLRIEGINLNSSSKDNYHPYYVLNNVEIDEPFILRVSVSIAQVVICIVTTTLVSMWYFKKYKT